MTYSNKEHELFTLYKEEIFEWIEDEDMIEALEENGYVVYDSDGDEIQPWDFNALTACGSLRSTVNDLLLYAKANIKSDYVPLSDSFALTHKITYTKDPVVGLGWHLLQEDGARYYWHNGGTGGSRSYLILNTEKKIALVVLSNSNVSVDDIGISILRKII